MSQHAESTLSLSSLPGRNRVFPKFNPTFFRHLMPFFVIQEGQAKFVKIADLQAHNSMFKHHDARHFELEDRPVSPFLKDFRYISRRIPSFGHTKFPPPTADVT